MNVAIVPGSEARIPLAIGPLDPQQRGIPDLPEVQLGTIVKLDDTRFSDANGKLGLWQPAEFVFKIGAGIYFLEPYDEDKVPVLFIHGVTGHPANFTYLVEHLDRKRFQPWFAYYPSGIGLTDVGRSLARWLALLQVQHGYSKIVLVAHSMGGLVTRALVNEVFHDPDASRVVRLEALVTISTPWGGHASAASGVENAPVVVPSWKDMVPGSKFLTDLVAADLPPECEHHLFFSYQGSTPFIRGASDGVVAVASELPLAVQRRAKRVLGFSEDHMSILRSEDVSKELNGVLDEAAE
jgi:pimeloyl-ACP methyl ester carboxylesterase